MKKRKPSKKKTVKRQIIKLEADASTPAVPLDTSKFEFPLRDQKGQPFLEKDKDGKVIVHAEPAPVSWPKTWWQHFKQDCFPVWALKRWPVERESFKPIGKLLGKAGEQGLS